MSQITKYLNQKKRYELGIIPLVVVLALAAASAFVMGGAYIINTSRDNGLLETSSSKLSKSIEDQGIYLDESKVKNSSFNSNVVGTVILSDGSFSAYKIIDGEITSGGDQFVGTAKVSFLSGDQALDNFNDGTIAPFYLKDGTKTVAQIVDKVVANLVVDENTSYAIKVLQGKIENGKLTGDFVGQTYDSGFIFAGSIDESGKVTRIVVKSGAQKTTEVESVIAKNAISLFGSISGTASNMKVLGVSDYKPTGFNKPIFDDEKGTWVFAGGTLNGSVSVSPIQGVVNYIQSVAQSISNGNGIYKQLVDQVDESNSKSNKEKSVATADLVDVSQIDLSSIDGQVNSDKISDGAITISKLSAANSASNGNCLTYDSSSGQFKWGNCGNGGGGTITAVNAGNGLTGGGTSGSLSLAVSLLTGGGLQATGSGVSLLRTCSVNEILKWDGNSWTCAADAGGAGGGVTTLQVDDSTVVSSAGTIDFLGTDFNLTNSPAGEGNLSIDYTNSKITRSDQTQSITGTWTFSNGLVLGTDTVSDITGGGLSISGGALTVGGLTTSNFASGNISQWTNNAGYITGNQSISLSGDVTGSGTTSITTAIGNGAVTLSKMANLAANSIIGNNTGSAATPVALTGSQVKTMLGITTSDVSGLGTIATQNANNVSITGGSLSGLTSVSATTFTGALTGNASSATTATTATTANALANTDAAGQSAITAINSATSGTINTARLNSAVTTQGNTFNGVSQLVKLDSSGYLPALNGSLLTGLTKSQVGLSLVENTALSTWAGSTNINTIANKTVTLARMADMATSSFLGRNSAGSGTPEVLSVSTVKSMLSLGTGDISGLGTIATQSAGNVFVTGGNITGVNSINGATITGGSLSSSAVNGVTTGNILVSTGNYSNPTWLSGLTASHLTAGDFSTKINSGTYSINVSGSAGSAGTVTGLSVTSGKTLTVQKSMTFTSADDTGVYTFPTGTATLLSTTGSAANLTNFPTFNQNTTGTAAGLSSILTSTMGGSGVNNAGTLTWGSGGTLGTAAYTAITDYATAAQGTLATNALPSTSFTDAAVTGKLLTGYVSGAGAVAATDSILQAIQKLNGNEILDYDSGNFVAGTNYLAPNGSAASLTNFPTFNQNTTGTASNITGVLGISSFPAMDGDVTNTQGDLTTTIAAGAVTLGKMANLAANSIIGNNTGSAATPVALSASQVKSLLSIANTDVSGLGTMSTQNSNNVSITGGSLSGLTSVSATTFTGALTGNASTVTNGVYTDGSYSNPTWITALSPTKVLPDQTGNGGKVLGTNGSALSWVDGGSAATWGTITGTLSNQTDLSTALSGKLGTGLTSTYIFVGNGSGIATGVSMTGDVAIDNTGATTIALNSVALGGDTTGNYVSGATTNGGLSLTGTEGASLGILLPTATDNLSTTVNSGSGLELLSSGVALLQGCADGQLLKWNEANDYWYCASDSTGGAGTLAIQEGGSQILGAAVAVNFASADFTVNDQGSNVAGIAIDYSNSKITRSDQTQSISGAWTFSDLTITDTNIPLSGGSLTLDFKSISDRTLTITNSSGGAANFSVGGTISASNFSGSSSGTNTGDNAANSNYASDYRAANFVAGTNYLAPTGSAASLTNFPTFNQNTTGTASNITGVLGASSFPAMTGDVTNTQGSLSTTIGSGVVTLGKMANLAANSIIGNNTGSAATPVALTASQVKTLLGISTTDVTGLGNIATQSAGNVFITGGNMIGLNGVSATTFTGALSGNATTATTANALANSDSAGQSAITAINSATSGTINSARIGTLPYISTSLTSANIIVGNGSGQAAAVTMSGDVTIDNTGATTIGNSKVTLGKIANIADGTILGNNSGSAAAPIALTGSQVKTILGITTSDVSGLGTIATQNSNNVSITGGSMSGLTSVAATTFTGALTGNASTVTGLSVTSGKTLTLQKSMTFTSADDTGVYTFPTGTATLLSTTGSAANLTNFPTFNQNTTGTASNITGVLGATSFPALTGDVTNTQGSLTTTIANGAVTLGKMASLAANSIIGNNTGSAATPIALTSSQVKSLLSIANTDVSGLGTIATQSAGNVFITGGSMSGLTSVSATTFTGALTGNASTVTNGVYTDGSYSNPTWITALSPTKVLPDQTGNNGKVLSTNGSTLSWITNSSGVAWGAITGTLSEQTDLNTALGLKANTSSLGTISSQNANAINITGGTIAGLTGFSIRSSGSGAFDLTINNTENLTAGRALTITTGDAARTLTLTGDTSISGTNTGDNAANSNYASDYRAANFVAGTNYLAPTGSAASLTNFPTLNQNTTGTASNITGILGAASFPALDGDVTTTQGDLTTTIANGAVTLGKMANLAANSIIGNNTGSAATPVALSASQVKSLLSIANTDVSGLGTMSTQNANSVSITGGSMSGLTSVSATTFTGALTGNASTATKLETSRTIAGTSFDGSANISLANKFIVQGTSDSGLSGAQFLGSLSSGILKNTTTTGVLSIAVAGDFPTLNQDTTGTASNITGVLGASSFPALTGDVTNTQGSLSTTIGSGVVTLGKMANLAANSIIGNNTGSAATPIALTSSQVKTLLGISNTDVSGLGTMATQSASNVFITGGNVNGLASINGATITGGSLSSSAVNGVTTADIVLSTGSYNNPSWITALSPTKVLPDQTGNNGKVLSTNGSTLSWITNSSGVAWGAITGTLADQTDLSNAINAKLGTGLASANIFVGNGSGVATGVAMSGDVTIDNTGATTIGLNSVALGGDTTGNYVAGATTNGGLSLTGTEGATLGIVVPAATNDLSSTTSSGSGLELLSSGLTLLQGCADGQLLKWNETSDVWYCASDSTGGAGTLTFQEGGSQILAAAVAVNFTAADFVVADQGSNVAGVTIDYTNSKITRSDQTQSISGAWTFSNLTITDTNIPLSGGSLTLDFNSISDRTLTVTNSSGGAANFSVGGTISALNFSGSSSGTNTGDNAANSNYASDYRAANFVAGTNYLSPTGSAASLTNFPTLNQDTTGNAATVTNGVYTNGTYSDPSWITSLSATKVLPDQTGQNGKVLGTNGSVVSWVTNSSGVAWGAITGTLSDQSDLNTALGLKANTSSLGTMAAQNANSVSISGGSLSGLTGLSFASGDFDQSASSGTFKTGAGAVSLNGITTLASGKAFVITGGAGDPTATSGTLWYDTTAKKFKIVEDGTVKTLCNTTDLGCGTGGGGISLVKEGGTSIVTSATAANFAASDFVITDETGGQVGISIDYTNSKITRANQLETIIKPWTFSNSGQTAQGKAFLTLDQYENQDIFTASASGNTKMVINNNGYIGIGTSNPQSHLNIYDNSPEIRFEDDMGYTVRMVDLGGSEFDIVMLDDTGHGTNALNMNPGGENEYSSGPMADLGVGGSAHRFYINNHQVMSINAYGHVGVGHDKEPVGFFDVQGATTGKALAMFNETGDQAILTASASGITKMTLARTGDLSLVGGITAATSSTINGISISSGTITGATIAAGSNTLSGITATNMTAGDFSSVVNTGSYSINVSGSAGSVTGLSVTSGKTLTAQKTMTLTAADDTGVYTFPTGTKTLVATDVTSLSSLTSVGTLSSLSSSGTVTIGSGGNTFTFNPASAPAYAGTARPDRKEELAPEFPGAVLTGTGTGTMTSDFCAASAGVGGLTATNTTVCNNSGDTHNYYNWTTSQGTAQTYSIYLKWRVPDNFSGWDASNSIQAYAKRSDATNGHVNIKVYDTANALNNAGGTEVAGAANTWVQNGINISGGTWTAGSYITIQIDVTAAATSGVTDVGEINLNYFTTN